MKQTAVQWLFEQLCETPKDKFAWYYLFEKAKAMEKGQIKESFIVGNSAKGLKFDSEKYYNQTYTEK
jgi:hypothetical protein